MSQYMNFFIGDDEVENYYALASYSRNSEEYAVFEEHAGFETGVILTEELVSSIMREVEQEIAEVKESIVHVESILRHINEIDGNVKEKIEAIGDYENKLEFFEQRTESLNRILGVLSFLMNMLLENTYNQKPTKIFFGIEWAPDGYNWD